MRKRLAAILAAMVMATACAGGDSQEDKRFPTSKDFPATTMARTSFTAGGGLGWRISALATPARDASWKVVVISGTPSWSEYWAPTIAKLPTTREMIVADRPGFGPSEPTAAVPILTQQAAALSAMLDGPPNQRVVLIGQSYGAPIATLIASQHPDKVGALVLMSGFFGDPGPTAKRLVGLGAVAGPLLPRDLKNALAEVRGQHAQLPDIRTALAGLKQPVVVLHGDKDTFVPPQAARALAAEVGARYVAVPAGDHFLNACCVTDVLGAVELAIAEAEARQPGPSAVAAR
ncbi:MAG: alpha/beta hydrolase [Alphaproteobacteria bacterium]|nr:alpha/beta hydrolase [Alphaproteobacteria bacterium]